MHVTQSTPGSLYTGATWPVGAPGAGAVVSNLVRIKKRGGGKGKDVEQLCAGCGINTALVADADLILRPCSFCGKGFCITIAARKGCMQSHILEKEDERMVSPGEYAKMTFCSAKGEAVVTVSSDEEEPPLVESSSASSSSATSSASSSSSVMSIRTDKLTLVAGCPRAPLVRKLAFGHPGLRRFKRPAELERHLGPDI